MSSWGKPVPHINPRVGRPACREKAEMRGQDRAWSWRFTRRRVYRDHRNQLLHFTQKRQRCKEAPLLAQGHSMHYRLSWERNPRLIFTEQNPGQLSQAILNKSVSFGPLVIKVCHLSLGSQWHQQWNKNCRVEMFFNLPLGPPSLEAGEACSTKIEKWC